MIIIFFAILYCTHFITVEIFGFSDDLSKSTTIAQVDTSIIFISDTQAPIWYESLFISRHRNEEATAKLFSSILSDTTVFTLIHLGDVTAIGALTSKWKTIDTVLTLLNKRNVLTSATPGNHEYLFLSNHGEQNFRKRFPKYQRLDYTVRIGYIALVFPNSNFGSLSKSEETQQRQWYIQQLDSLEHDSNIDIVIVGCHHPPFTNSSIVSPSTRVKREFVPSFLQHNKCKLFISGHSHAFEHFRNDTNSIINVQKDFLVIGGGGGLLHPLLLGDKQRRKDFYTPQTKYRMFHYLHGIIKPNGLMLTVMMLNDDLSGPQPVYNLFIKRLTQ